MSFLGVLAIAPFLVQNSVPADDGTALVPVFAAQVDRRLDVPETEQRIYAQLLAQKLNRVEGETPQYAIIVDRNPNVQALLIYWMDAEHNFQFIGASPVSTGKPGQYEHFTTPTGVFEHTMANPDFRALGTKNENGIRGFGVKGMRVYDFGWQTAERGWGNHGTSQMRLEMHATDPDRLAQRLGTIQSEGCIRIPATLNIFIDHYGILDGAYDEAAAEGDVPRVLRTDRQPTPWSGRWLVVVDTNRTKRPDWSPGTAVRTSSLH